MPEILKERSELDPQFQWDLTPMFERGGCKHPPLQVTKERFPTRSA